MSSFWERMRRKPSVEEALLAGGVPQEEIEHAAAVGGLELLAIDRLLDDSPRTLSQRDIAAESGIELDDVSRVWRALGFPHVEPDEPVYTRADADMTVLVGSLLDRGLADADLTMQMARVIGQSLSRVAAAQVAVTVDRQTEMPAEEVAGAPFADRAELLFQFMPGVLEYVWRRHLEVEARRRLAQLEGADAEGEPATLVVGFADLVGFTALSQQIPESELAHVVGRFEEVAADVVSSHGGRLVKTIGDEVMFSADDIVAGAEIALGPLRAVPGRGGRLRRPGRPRLRPGPAVRGRPLRPDRQPGPPHRRHRLPGLGRGARARRTGAWTATIASPSTASGPTPSATSARCRSGSCAARRRRCPSSTRPASAARSAGPGSRSASAPSWIAAAPGPRGRRPPHHRGTLMADERRPTWAVPRPR